MRRGLLGLEAGGMLPLAASRSTAARAATPAALARGGARGPPPAGGPALARARWRPPAADRWRPLGVCTRSLAARVPAEFEPKWVGTPESGESSLPAWAHDERSPPASLRALAALLLAPLAGGAVAVHVLAGDGGSEAEYSRVALSWTLHYAGAVLSFAGAAHWGLQLAEFGVPRKSDYMALYYLSRFSGPVVFVLFGWLGSVLSTASPQEGSMWLLCGYVGLLSSDFLVWKYEMAPPWWLRWRAGFSAAAILSILLLLLSERNLYLGQKPKIRM